MRCPQPISVRRKTGSFDSVPCGKCMACLGNRRSSWSVRLEHELRASSTAFFVTLTYDDFNIYQNENTVPSVNKRHMQLFMKSLRASLSGVRFKYFLTAEYGSQTFRPHYHLLFFNIPLVSDDMYRILESVWKYGSIHVGTVAPASINYVTKYCVTKHSAPDGATPAFHLMSKGLGAAYVEKARQYHVSGKNFFVTKLGGEKVAMPRYYRDKFFSKTEKQAYAALMRKRSDETDKPSDYYFRVDASFARKEKKFNKHNIF